MNFYTIAVLTALFTAATVSASVNYYLFGKSIQKGTALEVVTDGQALSSTDFTEFLVSVVYNETFPQNGWDFLQVSPNASVFFLGPTASLDDAYYFAGYAEGLVTATKYKVFYDAHNYAPNANCTDWINEHMAYLKAQSLLLKSQHVVWHQVSALLNQLEGLADGFNAANLGLTLTFADVFRLNFRYEIGDVEIATSPAHQQHDQMSFARRAEHCSALIKVTDRDLFVSQDTWGGFENMIRQYKVYNFQTSVSFSGFAGQIHSGDDWYFTSSNLASQETTNGYYDNSLARKYVIPNSISEFLRVMVSNFLSDNGNEWVTYFAYNHSGTYPNQYMVVDFKQYAPGQTGQSLRSGLLWVVEEIPGNCTFKDVTQVLRDTGYWASYNIPYFPNIYQVSGFEDMYKKYGDFFSYTQYARPRIFKQRHGAVTDLATMQWLMQYNDYKNDPLSLITNCTPTCNPKYSPLLAIASRGDLALANATLPAGIEGYYSRSAFGAYDSKIISSTLLNQQYPAGRIFCGPTPQQPLFTWKGFGENPPPGEPNEYDFKWVTMPNVPLPTPTPTYANAAAASDNSRRTLAVGLGVGIPAVIIGVVVIVLIARKSRSNTADYQAVQ